MMGAHGLTLYPGHNVSSKSVSLNTTTPIFDHIKAEMIIKHGGAAAGLHVNFHANRGYQG